MSNYRLICADARELPLEDESVDCIVTSPPYWGLRDYKLKGQIGLEPTIEEYVAEIGKCLKEMYRVLKKTGCLFLNIGDTYATHTSKRSGQFGKDIKAGFDDVYTQKRLPQTVPEKCLCLIPDRIRLLMVDMGWIIRNRVIWHKPNSMPSSVKDRFSNAYEDVIFAVKQQKYWFDLDAVREPHSYPEDVSRRMRQDKAVGVNPFMKGSDQARHSGPSGQSKFDGTQYAGAGSKIKGHSGYYSKDGELLINPAGKNPGDVWTINTEPYPKAHYATFPQKLVKKCLLAGCPKEICTKCGKARVRITKTSLDVDHKQKDRQRSSVGNSRWHKFPEERGTLIVQTIGWTDCGCGEGFRPGVMLDPFCGSGTALKVGIELGLDVIGVDKKQEYLDQHAKKRIGGAQMPLIK